LIGWAFAAASAVSPVCFLRKDWFPITDRQSIFLPPSFFAFFYRFTKCSCGNLR
jgi:hypothetical protein